jgi:hypothetical protein
MTDKTAPAFPYEYAQYSGLTKREYAAIAAMQGLLSNSAVDFTFTSTAEMAIQYADALINKLEATNG